MRLEVSFQITFQFFKRFHTNVGRVANDRIKSAYFHNGGKFRSPIKDIDTESFLIIKHMYLYIIVKIRSDKRIAAFDVMYQIRQSSLVEYTKLHCQSLPRFTLKYFEKQ